MDRPACLLYLTRCSHVVVRGWKNLKDWVQRVAERSSLVSRRLREVERGSATPETGRSMRLGCWATRIQQNLGYKQLPKSVVAAIKHYSHRQNVDRGTTGEATKAGGFETTCRTRQ